IRQIGPKRFCAIGSDSTGNTKWAGEGAADEIKTLLIVPDPCHHLSNTIKDITRLSYFIDVISKKRETITYFSQSTYSATHLNALRVILSVNHGLEKIGKTRFGTLYWAGYTLLPNLPLISDLITMGDKAKLAWFKQLRVYQNFELELKQLVTILEPIARAIKCLEGLEVTVGDVWKFYVAITAVIRDLFDEDVLSFPQSLKDEVCAIVNHRFEEMIDGPSGDIYLVGFYLDPGKIYSGQFLCTLIQFQNTSKARCCSKPQPINSAQRHRLGHHLLDLLAPVQPIRISGIQCPHTERLALFLLRSSRRSCRLAGRPQSSSITNPETRY
ncbi:hypothetical protein B0H10DRAFT_1779160, partial [Mycena sp. CBHHK59/15]